MRKLILSVAVVAFCSVMTAYALDLNITGAGARAKGMGGAFIGIADDATAVGWNPAGLAQLDRPEASAVGVFNMSKFKDTWSYTGSGVSLEGEDENSAHHIAPNFFSLVLPVKMSGRNLAFAVAYQRMVDFGQVSSDTGTLASGHYTQEDKFTGGIDAISPAIALQIVPQFSIGVAGNILVRGAKLTQERTYDNSAYFYNYEETMNFRGFNINAGVLANLNKNFGIGASFRLPFTMTRTGEWEESYNYISGSGSSSGKLPDPEREWTMPMMIGAGLAVRPSENLTLGFDFEHRGYSGTDFTYHWEVGGVEYDTTYNAGWMSTNQFRVGLEYLFVGPKAVFPVRLGFKTNPQLDPKIEANATSVDSSAMSGIGFTGGFGLKMGRLWLDLAYELDINPYTDNTYTASDGSVWKEEGKETSHNILLSCIYHF